MFRGVRSVVSLSHYLKIGSKEDTLNLGTSCLMWPGINLEVPHTTKRHYFHVDCRLKRLMGSEFNVVVPGVNFST